ncbi:MAG: tRNA (adenosine(37)-N6)-dimethylallyltransferase MiaA [Candidatus Nanopelagicales bacterium]|nr:tRNA (adenosine(37)-N6)-dimethylallyltransferase MiaA [Candidatus Nanopelagicales bacterium]
MTVLAVIGPTAVGKSALGVAVAQRLEASGTRAEIISADSMQAYIGMDIGTATPTMAERGGITHHLLDVWPVEHALSVAEYQQAARDAIADVSDRGAVPILVGGSGLYVSAILDDLQFPGTDAQVRDRYERQLLDLGPEALHARLAEVDPAAAAAILPTNGRRIVRALEVVELTGEPFVAQLPAPVAVVPAVRIGLSIPRDVMDARIEARVLDMFAAGLVDEVRGLPGLAQGVTAARAIGYTQVLDHLAGTCTREEAISATIAITRKFARRQQRWFARDPRIVWCDYDDASLVARACALLGEDTRL